MAKKLSGAVDQGGMRLVNLSVVMRSLAEHNRLSRTDISELTGLTKPAVSGLVSELEMLALVREAGPASSANSGRPPTLLEIDGSTLLSIAVQINVGRIGIVVRDLALRVLERETRSLDARPDPASVLEDLRIWVDELVSRLAQEGHRVVGVVVGAPALVHQSTLTIVEAPALGWSNVDLATLPSDSWGHFQLENLANLAALTESRLPRHGRVHELVHLEVGSGVGAGIVLDGVVERGSGGLAGVIGHMPLDPDGALCACGRRGCLEALAGAAALIGRTILNADAVTQATGRPGAKLIEEVADRASSGDEVVLSGIAETGRWIGRGSAVLINMLNPDVLTLGGYVRDLEEWILPSILQEIDAMVIAPNRAGCRVLVSQRGVDEPEFGAALMIRDGVIAPSGLEALSLVEP